MTRADQRAIILANEGATIAFSQVLQALLQPGDIVTLAGDLGAGKSFLARSLLRHAAEDPSLDVPSPTFSLVQHYQLKDRIYLHADLYRLGDEDEADELGLFDDNQAVLLIEWPERLPDLAARAPFNLTLHLMPQEPEGRTLYISGAPNRVEALVQALESGSDSGIKLI